MKDLVLISHGHLAESLKESVEMIMGPQDNIHTVILLPEDGPDDFEARFKSTIENLDDFTVFADLAGGTPNNVASRILMNSEAFFDLYAGMNMPMVISFINAGLLGQEMDFVKEAQQNTVYVNNILKL